MTTQAFSFVAKSKFDSIAALRSAWMLSSVPPGSHVEIHLASWRNPAPAAVVGLVAAIGRLIRLGCTLQVERPHDLYARRMLETAGWRDALNTFGNWTWGSEPLPEVRRILPLLPIHNFRKFDDVEMLVESLETEFAKTGKLPSNLLQDVSTVLAEAADNAVWHGECPEGGFALVQVRRRQVFGAERWFVEVAVADAGLGIADSLGIGDDRNAILQAFAEGVSRTNDPHRGYGLHEIHTATLVAPERLVTIHSGTGLVAKGLGYDLAQTVQADFPGTLVSVQFPVKLR